MSVGAGGRPGEEQGGRPGGNAARTLTRKLLESRMVEGSWEPGKRIGIRIDQTLTQDATGTMACLQFEALGLDRVRTRRSVSYIDHNTLQVGFENADDHRYLAGVAARYGMVLSRAGNGICHQVHLERFGEPGLTLLGSDSHTPTGGALGMVAIGAGGLDVALAMGGVPFRLLCPKVVSIRLSGRLSPWVSAKDVILAVLARFGTKGNVDSVFEYSGEGVLRLSVPERATIANMGAECGVTTSVFPSDGRTKEFLELQGRGESWIPLSADPDAAFDAVWDLDLSSLEPLVAGPHSPGNVMPLREVRGLPVSQVCVGSCTNSSFRDLARVATLLRGRTVRAGTELVVAPGSRQVVQALAESGHLKDLIAAGARLVEPSCSFCVGNGHSPASGSTSLRTSNRNFEARSGTKDAQVWLCSPEVAAVAALTGCLTDPREAGLAWPGDIECPSLDLSDSMMIFPVQGEPSPGTTAGAVAAAGPVAVADAVPGSISGTAGRATAGDIPRGPNIGSPPRTSPLPPRLEGEVAIVVGDRITTDHIIPAGPRMKYRSNIAVYSQYVFENVDSTFASRAAALRDAGKVPVIVAGESYGQGSSREHAAICPAHLGVRLVLARSFERIHAANLVNFGIIPAVLPEGMEGPALGERVVIEDLCTAVESGGRLRLLVGDPGRVLEVNLELDSDSRQTLLAGGALLARLHFFDA